MITTIMTLVYTALHQMQMLVGFIVHLSVEQHISRRTMQGACARHLRGDSVAVEPRARAGQLFRGARDAAPSVIGNAGLWKNCHLGSHNAFF